jgi:hypothetical protein
VVEVQGTWRVDPAQLGQPFTGRAALLPRSTGSWKPQAHDRAIPVRLPAGDVQPAAKRPLRLFRLPVLYGDQLVGKLDATADRKAGILGSAPCTGRAVDRR